MNYHYVWLIWSSGPGIGGFKHDSEVGMAMHEGHPVYFAIFFPEPCPGQTLADVHHTLRRFVEEISRRHHGQAPVLYGNCQGGWAVALLSADCEGLAGPAVLNGSPLSYWAGASDVNPMRVSNYVWSEKLNPWMYAVAAMAATAQAARQPVDDTNPFIGLERQVSAGMAQALEHYRKLRDSSQETAFRIAYR